MGKTRLKPTSKDLATADSFQNFLTKTGVGTPNLHSASTYGFNPISRNHVKLEWMYRGSWVVGRIIDCIPEDMTRAGVTAHGLRDPGDQGKLDQKGRSTQIGPKMLTTFKWGRLYGGCIGLLMVDGQAPDTPLRIDTIGRNQFKGILPLDRWSVQPSYNELVSDMGPDFGLPVWYDTIANNLIGIPSMRIHYSRIIRFDGGIDLPYWQRAAENLWSCSALERVYDRLIAYDSATSGAAQMTYKAHLRTYKVKDLRDIIAAGGRAMDGLAKQVEMIRAYQSNEGLTLMDAEDEFQVDPYNFAGLSELLLAFGEQLAGAAETPLTRLFGQSPGGLGSNGESERQNYHDTINQKQEATARVPYERAYSVLFRSTFGQSPPEDFSLEFNPLHEMTDEEKSKVTSERVAAIVAAYSEQIINRATAMKELKSLATVTGAFTNITDEDIEAAKNDPDPTPETLGLVLPTKPDAGPGSKAKEPGKVSEG